MVVLRCLLIGSLALSACAHVRRPEVPEARWVAVWAASPQQAGRPLRIAGQSLREVVHISLGGNRVRLRLSNAYGATPLHVGSAHLAIHVTGPSIAAGSDRAVTFDGSP